MVRQELLAHLDHGAIDFNHGDVFDAAMFGNFAQHTAIAATDNQHALGCAVGEDRYVGEHLVVDEFVGFSGLDNAVERHDPAHARVLEDHQMLMLGAHFVQQFFHTEALAVTFIQRLLIIAHG